MSPATRIVWARARDDRALSSEDTSVSTSASRPTIGTGGRLSRVTERLLARGERTGLVPAGKGAAEEWASRSSFTTQRVSRDRGSGECLSLSSTL